MSDTRSDNLILGRISSVFGVKGWVKVVSHTRPRDNIFSYPDWLVQREGQWQKCRIESGRPHGKTLIAKLKGVDSREQAESWVGTEIAVSRDMLPETDSGDYYWADLIGLEVKDLQGESLGTVDRLMETGSNDVLVVKDSRNNQQRLIPWLIDQVVIRVDLDAKLIEVDWDKDF